MKYFLVAGESSGDLHGANLIKAIQLIDENAIFEGCGGKRMKAVSCKLCLSISDMDFMGFTEVIKHLPQILNNFSIVENAIRVFKPDVLILIDYPGFNLRLLKKLKDLNTKKVYYIPPQLWAWKKGRIKILKEYCDEVLTILPFEKAFYDKNGLSNQYVGHPLLDEIQVNRINKKEKLEGKFKSIALLPGSRKQEIDKLLPIYLEVAKRHPTYEFKVAAISRFDLHYYKSFKIPENVQLVFNQTYNLLSKVDFAVVTSGTATLETALFNVPQVVCYRLSWLSYQIGKRFAKVKYISLVNLIMDHAVVTELIQEKCSTNNISENLSAFFESESKRETLLNHYQVLHEKLGDGGASKAAAKIVYALGSSI